MNLRRVFVYFPAFAKGYLRNPLGLFFSLIFPVILILIFGAVFANSGSSAVPLTVQNLDSNSPVSQQFLESLNATGAVSLSFVSPGVGNLSTYLSHNSLSAGLVIPAGFAADVRNKTPVHLLVYTNPSSGGSTGIVEGAIQGAAYGMNLRLAGGSEVVTPLYLNVGSTIYKYIDYLVPGLVGFSVLVSPMFSMVNISSTWKRDKLFRQLSLTPLSRAEWLTATLLWYVILACASAFLLVAVGKLVFGAHVTVTWLAAPFLVVGPVFFVALGLLAGSVSSTPESAGVVGNIITFPMMFLSGTFFPVSLFPSYLQTVAHVLPLYYVIDGLNASMVFDNPAAAYVDLLIVGVLAIIFSVLAARAFSWREL
jgi:ABC-2 type transport system permease protein